MSLVGAHATTSDKAGMGAATPAAPCSPSLQPGVQVLGAMQRVACGQRLKLLATHNAVALGFHLLHQPKQPQPLDQRFALVHGRIPPSIITPILPDREARHTRSKQSPRQEPNQIQHAASFADRVAQPHAAVVRRA